MWRIRLSGAYASISQSKWLPAAFSMQMTSGKMPFYFPSLIHFHYHSSLRA
jgi:hypothetical protein